MRITSGGEPGKDGRRVARQWGTGLAAILACGLATGCMTSQREEELQANILRLERKLSDVEKQILVRDRSLDTVKSSSEDAARRAQSTKGEIEDVRRQLALTQGALDELRVKMTRMQETAGANLGETSVGDSGADAGKIAAIDDNVLSLERRMTRLELLAAPLIEKHQNDKPAPKRGEAGKGQGFKTAGELSRTLGSSYSAKDFKKVIAKASDVIEARPGNDQLEVALEFRGTAYFQTQEYQRAATDFTEFLDRFPKSERRARALLFAGDSFVYLKQNRTARAFYSECVKTYPERDECKAAKERLDKMGG